jgi:hypothetical protein
MIFQAKFKANKIIKALLLILANLFLWLDKLTVKEFGNIGQNKIEKNILTSSYYLVAYKK